MAERSNAAVLKTVEGNTSGGSNPSLSADKLCKRLQIDDFQAFLFLRGCKSMRIFAKKCKTLVEFW
jgi:hypothetical protein